MDSNNSKNQDTSNVKKLPDGNSNNSNQQDYSVPIEPPPCYDEAVQNAPYTGHFMPRSSVPVMEKVNRCPYSYTTFRPGHFPPIDAATIKHLHDERFPTWDNRATTILTTKRLQMNNQFKNAISTADTDLLWAVILCDLLDIGYNLTILDLIHYWEFIFYIYRSIYTSLSSGVQNNTNWEYFEPMNNVFGSNADELNVISTPTSIILPIKTLEPNNLLNSSATSSAPTNPDVSSSNIASTNNLPSCTQETSNASILEAKDSVSENTPLLMPNGAGNSNLQSDNLLPSSSSGVEPSIVTPAAADFNSLKELVPSTEAASNLVRSTDVDLKLDAITTQPEVCSLPKIPVDVVVTTQPTFSPAVVPVATSNDDGPTEGDGGCCGDNGCCGDDSYCDGSGCCNDVSCDGFDCDDC